MSRVTRVALLGDTHGALDARIADLIRQCDIAVHTGDIGGAAILEALRPKLSVFAIRGNNDDQKHWPADEYDQLCMLVERQIVALPGGALAVIHGHQWPAKNRVQRLRDEFPKARAVVFGHSHRLLVDKQKRPWVLNPGAAGRTRTYGGPSCLVLTASQNRWSLQTQRFTRS